MLPGVGPRSAQRMAYYLLQHDRAGAEALAASLGEALRAVRHCARCNNFTEEELCALCRSPRRDPVAAVRRRNAGRPGDGRADAELLRNVFRADGAALAAGRRRPARHRPGPAARARRRRRGAGGDPRDEFHQRGRGDGALHRRDAARARDHGRRASRAACRSAANSSTWTSARFRRRCWTGAGYSSASQEEWT